MTITKGTSQEQEFFESHHFLCQNGRQPEFHTYPRTTEVTWTVQLPEKFENAIFWGIF